MVIEAEKPTVCNWQDGDPGEMMVLAPVRVSGQSRKKTSVPASQLGRENEFSLLCFHRWAEAQPRQGGQPAVLSL